MKITTQWKNGMLFQANSPHHEVLMDTASPIGSDLAMTPKQLVIAGLCGCTAMDVVALMKKYKQEMKSFSLDAEVEKSTKEDGYPEVFKKVDLSFKVTGEVDAAKLLEAIHLSQTKYCGVSAMLSKAFPIFYEVYLNEIKIGAGSAQF